MNESRYAGRLRVFAVAGAIISFFALFSLPAFAQAFPDRVIRVIVPWPAGGTADILTRVVTQQLTEKFSQGVIVDNRPGANSIIGTAATAKATPNGYTLLSASVETSSLNPHVYLKLPYDPRSAFVPIAPVARSPYVIAGQKGLPAETLKDLTALLKAQPGKHTYGSWGIGSVAHVGMEMIIGKAGLNVLHVPFNGGPPAYSALVGGQIDMIVLPAGMAPGLRSEGKIKVFAVTTANRFWGMADVPTLKEQGHDVELAQVIGFMAPANTSRTIVDLLHAKINEILGQSDVQATLKARNAEGMLLSREQYAAFLRSELARWGEVIQRANIKIDK